MKHFIDQLMKQPDGPQTTLIQFTKACGCMYLGIGMLFLLFPSIVVHLGILSGFQGQEEGLFRMLGLTIAIIGYFYWFGARTQATSFALSTVVDRLLVPFVFLFIYLVCDVHLMLVLPMAILDPILAVVAFLLWKKQESSM